MSHWMKVIWRLDFEWRRRDASGRPWTAANFIAQVVSNRIWRCAMWKVAIQPSPLHFCQLKETSENQCYQSALVDTCKWERLQKCSHFSSFIWRNEARKAEPNSIATALNSSRSHRTNSIERLIMTPLSFQWHPSVTIWSVNPTCQSKKMDNDKPPNQT